MSTKRQFLHRMILLAASVGLIASLVPPAVAEQDEVVLSVGAYDMVRRENDSGYVGLDYQIPREVFRHLKPWVGVLSTSDGAFWGGGGLSCDWAIGRHLRLTPSFGGGFYEEGDGKDLGHTLEFRSQLGVSYHFESEARIGITFGHLSNGGLSDSNSGTEYLNVSYTLPLTRRQPGSPLHASQRASVEPREE